MSKIINLSVETVFLSLRFALAFVISSQATLTVDTEDVRWFLFVAQLSNSRGERQNSRVAKMYP